MRRSRSASGPGRAARPGSAPPLVGPIALLLPGIAAVVVAVGLPEAGLVVVGDAKPGDPFGALPEIEVGDQQAGGTAVLTGQRLALVLGDDPGLAFGQVLDRQVGR